MDVVLGVSMTPAAVRMALVEGEDADGLIVEEDSFQVARDSATASASDQVIAAILGTREGAVDAGFRLSSIGVTWTDHAQAAALRDALATRKIENVMLVSGLLAAAALGQAVGGAIGYERTAVLFIEPEAATLAVVDSADGSVWDVRRQLLAEDDDTAVAEVVAMVSGIESMENRPDGVYVVGAGVDVALIKPALDAATSLTVSAPEEHEMALARGAALASGNAPLFASSTAALAYAQDLQAPDVAGGDDLAYSTVPDHVAEEDTVGHRPGLLIGSAVAVVVIAAVVALEVAAAIGIRPTVALLPRPSESRLVAPTQQAPPPTQVAAPRPKVNLPAPRVVPRAASPQVQAPLPAAPVAPAPAAPVLPDPVVAVPPLVPIRVPLAHSPVPETLLRPQVPQAPEPRVQAPKPRVQAPKPRVQAPKPRVQAPVSPPRIASPAPQSPVRQTPPGLGPSSPRPGRGPGGGGGGHGGLFGGGGHGGLFGGGGHGGLFGGGGHGGLFGGGGHGGLFGGGGHGGGFGGGGFGGGHGGGFGHG